MRKVTEPVKVTSTKGALTLCLFLVYSALKDGVDLDSDPLLANSAYCLGLTGISINYLKSLIKQEYIKVEKTFNKEALLKDCTVMPISAVAKKYGKTEAAVYGLCNRNKVNFKKVLNADTTNLADTIKSFKGTKSLEQIAKATNHSWSFVKDFCIQNDLEYRAGGR